MSLAIHQETMTGPYNTQLELDYAVKENLMCCLSMIHQRKHKSLKRQPLSHTENGGEFLAI